MSDIHYHLCLFKVVLAQQVPRISHTPTNYWKLVSGRIRGCEQHSQADNISDKETNEYN